MDCDKFDQHVMDALYDELDELTYAALKRHVEGCPRCAGIWAGLRATRDVGVLPMVEPSDGLEARILEAVSTAQAQAPWPRRVLRGLAWAGSHAMRPQLAMAALFMLVVGSSLLLLRGRPSNSPVAASRVQDQSAPALGQADRGAPPPAATAAAALAEAPQNGPIDGLAAGNAAPAAPAASGPVAQADRAAEGRVATRDEQSRAKGDDAPLEGASEARALFASAMVVKSSQGCGAALPKLDAVAVRFPGTQTAAEAMWEEATCYKQMGNTAKARDIFLALRQTGLRDRADAELGVADNNNMAQQNIGGGMRAGKAAAPAAAAPAAPAAKPADPPAQVAVNPSEAAPPAKAAAKRPSGGGTGKANAAPRKAADYNSGF